MFKFNDPYFFLILPIILSLFLKKRKKSGIKIASVEKVKSEVIKSKKYLIGKYLIMLSLIAMTIALARPQILSKENKVKKDGIDIVICLDLSKSMLNRDFEPNRLEKSKEIIESFVSKRQNDRLSLVIFGGDAYTKVPLTFDNKMMRETIGKITVEDITSNNRTAIGMGLGVSLNRLKESKAKSKIIILMTDGENNSGELSPEEATKLATNLGIKVYTVGIGAIEIPWAFGVQKIKNTELDENLLNEIAKKTGGKYFRASDEKTFNEIFKEIDSLEKTKIEARDFYSKEELFIPILKLAILMLVVGIFFEFLLFIRIP